MSGKTSYGGSTGLGASVSVPIGNMRIRVGGSGNMAREKRESTLLLDFIDTERGHNGTGSGLKNSFF